ncbi:MAG: TetR/AcrR family transcriptional regulator [Parvibaculum sp.]|uniref:TetR/AcrR family transcriptional regulator n=2 Tax=Parvibaculum sp. TaxID=2024848 RepID=UPI00272F5FED|nr:TetR/AcrR family transcriptional regulator [Parvibaculum sp.]MDP1627699.1 TetR/AcrR family transcriptional regulator [Parvibaculum sp.]MDP2150697.1 TetR/AcrR family transcriptional regulator [Parvibaculum sp.]MDP3328030.1 TetR/AcrR family transcriptional regulator [Parvibaculum sp.]
MRLWDDNQRHRISELKDSMTPPPGQQKQDGRRLRSEVSRRRIVEAMRELIREGAVAPRAEEVAARADVGLRSVFRHFDDMESLYREIAEAMLVEVTPMLNLPQPAGTTAEIVAEMIDRRIKLFERIMPFRTAADVHLHRSPFLLEDRLRMNEMLRKAMRSALPAEFRKDRTLLDALEAVFSFEFWRRLRWDQQLSPAQARRTVELAVSSLLDAKPRGKA